MSLQDFFFAAKSMSLVLVFLTFCAIVVYALWPSLQPQMDEAARLPLNED